MNDELIAFDDALDRVTNAVRAVGVELVPLDAALGRVVASDLAAQDDIVPFARSAMDGYAVRARDVLAGRPLIVAATVVAGDPIIAHRAGTATAIATGAALPRGADAVLPWEDVTIAEHSIVPHGTTVAGAHLFCAGDDARRGDLIVRAGDTLEPGILAFLAAAGIAAVPVHRRPRVRILCSGDELVPVGRTPEHGRVRDSNGVLLRALVTRAGAEVDMAERVGDDPDAIAFALRRAIRGADLVITTGGASRGPRDGMKPALDALGARFLFRSVALRPAKPVAFARLGEPSIAVLPGNPSAAFAAFHLLVAPALAIMSGGSGVAPRVEARLSAPVSAKSSRTYAVHVRVVAGAHGLVARVLENQCSSLVGVAARANGLALIPPGTRTYGAGTVVDVALFGTPLPEREGAAASTPPARGVRGATS